MDGGALRIALGAWVLLVGAAVGSFLNVVIARLPAGESIVRPRSRCPACKRPIPWHENVPVLSWLLLRGRCRGCGAAISPRYLVVELLGAAAAFLAWRRHGLSADAAAELALAALLLALAFIDLATWLLPHALTWPLLGAGLAASALGLSPAPSLGASALGAAAGFAAFYLVSLLGKAVARREAMGMGDVWLLAGIGAWLGVAALLPVVLLASVQGSVVGIVLIVAGKAQPGPAPGAPEGKDADWVPPRNSVPFGPFLALGALEWLYLADAITSLVPALDVFR